jgi:hypothetical protein
VNTYISGGGVDAGRRWAQVVSHPGPRRVPARPSDRPDSGHGGGRTVNWVAACAALTVLAAFALTGCAGATTTHHPAVAAAAATTATPPVPAYVARLRADGYTPVGSCALHGAQGVGQAWGDDGNGNGELLIEAKTADEAATLAAAMNNFANAAGSSGSLTITVAGNFVVITGPVGAVDNLGKAGC